MIAKRVSTMADVAREAAIQREFTFPLRDFLDGFYSEPSAEKLSEEPPLLGPVFADDGFADAFLAAVSDSLSRTFYLPPPEWIASPNRVLRTPHFSAKSHGLRMIHLQESPTAFRERNIFVSANVLSRA